MQRLTGVDATFLYLETPSSHMHVSSLIIADPATAVGTYSFEDYKQMVRNRLHLSPPWRRRLVTVPFGLHHPIWIEDPDFDLDFHVRRAALPSPGGPAELAEYAAEFHSRQLDRSRPLWMIEIVEGLEGGLIASLGKTHHAAIDGVSGAELIVNLLDLSPEITVHPDDADTWQPERVPSDFEMLSYAASSLARQPLAAAKAARRTFEFALNLRKRNREPEVSPPPSMGSAPRTSINGPITAHRRFAMADIGLEDVKKVKNAFGCTVNDVVLTVCSGMFRRYFEHRGETPESDLVAMIPVSVRTEEQAGTMGNQVSMMMTSLGTTVDDPLERVKVIQAVTKQAKEQENAISASTLSDWSEFMAPAVAARAARLYSNTKLADRHRPLWNVVISNVPGPNIPLYSGGAQMKAMYPMGPISDGTGLNITVMSYMGNVHFGLVADRELVPDVDLMPGFLQDALDELVKVADAQAASGQAPALRRSTGKPKGAGAVGR